MAGELVTFGIYKGKPVEALLQDRGYCEWLLSQGFLKTKYPTIATLIINNYGAPAETPEHNAMQARFTDDAWVAKAIVAHLGGWDALCERFNRQRLRVLSDYRERWRSALARLGEATDRWEQARGREGQAGWENYLQETRAILADAVKRKEELRAKIAEWASMKPTFGIWRVAFEAKGADAEVEYDIFPEESVPMETLRVECKPVMGDDFPAVLRQVQANRCNLLIVGEYVGVGASWEQVKGMFASAGVKALFVREVEECQVPDED